MRRGAGGRGLGVLAAVFGASLGFSTTAWAKPVPELTVSDGAGPALAVSIGTVSATQAPAGPGEVREAISITSVTPSVCEVLGYVWGPSDEPPPEREMVAEVRYFAAGTCTFVASVKATSTTEAKEVSQSVMVVPPLPTLPNPGPTPTFPEIRLGAPSEAYLGANLSMEAKSTRPGLQVSSTTPSVCMVTPKSPRLGVAVRLITTGTCTVTASLPKTAEHEAVELTKSSSSPQTNALHLPPPGQEGHNRLPTSKRPP